jgi:hypothetical protein
MWFKVSNLDEFIGCEAMIDIIGNPDLHHTSGRIVTVTAAIDEQFCRNTDFRDVEMGRYKLTTRESDNYH